MFTAADLHLTAKKDGRNNKCNESTLQDILPHHPFNGQNEGHWNADYLEQINATLQSIALIKQIYFVA
jgi:hypothetical protein